MEEEFIKILKKYHKAAKKLDNKIVSDINVIKTLLGDCDGFIINDNIIFFHPDSLAILIQTVEDKNEDDLKEISLYDLKEI